MPKLEIILPNRDIQSQKKWLLLTQNNLEFTLLSTLKLLEMMKNQRKESINKWVMPLERPIPLRDMEKDQKKILLRIQRLPEEAPLSTLKQTKILSKKMRNQH